MRRLISHLFLSCKTSYNFHERLNILLFSTGLLRESLPDSSIVIPQPFIFVYLRMSVVELVCLVTAVRKSPDKKRAETSSYNSTTVLIGVARREPAGGRSIPETWPRHSSSTGESRIDSKMEPG